MLTTRIPRAISRRAVLAAGAAGLAAALPGRHRVAAQATPESVVVGDPVGMTANGPALPGLDAFDRAMSRIMSEWGLPGGQLAVARGPRLLLDRGYGIADPLTGELVSPDSRFRIASVSKTITAVTALALVDDGALLLDEPVFRILSLAPPRNAVPDPRLREITLRMLLTHSGGWDSSTGLDPQYLPMTTYEANLLGVDNPPEASEIVRAMLGAPLDFDPGTRSAYSNFGFNVIGRLIEAVTGELFGEVAARLALAPAGAVRTELGRTRWEQRAPGEVVYSGPEDAVPVGSVFPGEGYVPFAYGGYYLEAMDSHGGFIAPASDLVRFALAVDGTRGPALLAPETVREMLETPRPGASDEPGGGARNFGLGWGVAPGEDGPVWSHAGALTDTCGSWLVRYPDGTTIAAIFNSLPDDYGAFFGAAISLLQETAAGVAAWPEGDLFGDGEDGDGVAATPVA
jgi:N-acyl-D-amino-acid deacylase